MFEINHTWTSTGSSGGLTPVEVRSGVMQSALFCQTSTLASTSSFSFQTAQESTGPWFTEGSTSLSTALAQQAVLRVTGPYAWMRPFIHSASTGTFQFKLIGTD